MDKRPKRGRPKKDAADRSRKDKMLHTRIPERLDQHLKEQADTLGLSVSSIVRHVLVNTFNMVEGVVAESANIADILAAKKPDGPPETPPEASRVGWQPLVLDVNAVCSACNDLMPKGSRGALGVPARTPPEFLCASCLDTLETGTDPET